MKCYIWEIHEKTKVPKLVYESDNEYDFRNKVADRLSLMKWSKKSYGFRIER